MLSDKMAKIMTLIITSVRLQEKKSFGPPVTSQHIHTFEKSF